MAQSNKALNISDVNEWRRENEMIVHDVTNDDAANIRTMLCMPIVNGAKDVIGVAQLINKVGSQTRIHKYLTLCILNHPCHHHRLWSQSSLRCCMNLLLEQIRQDI